MADTQQNAAGFVWFELMTTDLEAAKAFYGKVVGWQTRDSGMPGIRYELFGVGSKDVGGMMSVQSAGSGPKQPTWMGHIYTPAVDRETAAVTADGGGEIKPPADIPGVGRFAVVNDPQGAVYLLFQPSTDEAPERLGPKDVGNVGWCELGTTDWEAAWQFYSSHYGWQKDMAVDMGPMGTYQTFTTGMGGGGMMTMPADMRSDPFQPAWLFYFTVDSIQAAKQRVEQSGGRVLHGPMQVPGGAWILQGVDPQGAHFALTAAS